MRWLDSPQLRDLSARPTVVIGNFDGVHRGHHYVIERALALGSPLVALTFEPHPRLALGQVTLPFRLTSYQAKREALIQSGVENVAALRFDLDLAALTAEEFVRAVLVDSLRARHVVVGEDYRFGSGRSGDRHLLQRLGAASGFDVLPLAAANDHRGRRYSSSLIREAIAAGQPEVAASLLGRPWSISGPVSVLPGQGAALPLGDHVRPRAGTYSVMVERPGRRTVDGIAHMEEHAMHLLVVGIGPGPLKLFLLRRLDASSVAVRRAALCRPEKFSACL